ncbi:MAG TPA: hypothetical protein VF544_11385 [Pyrinomonadaceae bacterium]|jgi:DNA-directed RNA polymerase specialized sigma24 family protein
MADVSTNLKKDWALTQAAFDKLLTSLDDDRELAAEKYEVLRSKLSRFFQWRDCPSPEDHTDDVLNIVARKISEGETIENVSSYAYGVARMLCKEIRKKQEAEQRAFTNIPITVQINQSDDEKDSLHECLDKCIGKLPDESRELIIGYYQGDKREKIDQRQVLAAKYNITLNALRINACRIRDKLEICIDECLKTVRAT